MKNWKMFVLAAAAVMVLISDFALAQPRFLRRPQPDKAAEKAAEEAQPEEKSAAQGLSRFFRRFQSDKPAANPADKAAETSLPEDRTALQVPSRFHLRRSDKSDAALPEEKPAADGWSAWKVLDRPARTVFDNARAAGLLAVGHSIRVQRYQVNGNHYRFACRISPLLPLGSPRQPTRSEVFDILVKPEGGVEKFVPEKNAEKEKP